MHGKYFALKVNPSKSKWKITKKDPTKNEKKKCTNDYIIEPNETNETNYETQICGPFKN